MNSFGLNRAERRAYERALASDHQEQVRIELLDRNEKPYAELTAGPTEMMSGDVQIDTSRAVTRSAELEVLDPRGRLHVDPHTSSRYGVFVNHFVRVWHEIYVADLGRFEGPPVFTGSLTRFRREDELVIVEAQGKERLLMPPVVPWRPLTIPKGTRIVEAIRRIGRHMGERHFDLPELDAKLRHDVHLGRFDDAWALMKSLARDVDRQLFYRGGGALTLRRHPEQPVFAFRDGSGGTIKTGPYVGHDLDPETSFRNAFLVLGPEPGGTAKKKRERLRHPAKPRRDHPLHPDQIGRNGEPFHVAEKIELAHAKRRADLEEAGDRRLRRDLRAHVELDMTTLVVPHLEELDPVVAKTDDVRMEFVMKRWTIPLAGDDMPVGSNKRRALTPGRGK